MKSVDQIGGYESTVRYLVNKGVPAQKARDMLQYFFRAGRETLVEAVMDEARNRKLKLKD